MTGAELREHRRAAGLTQVQLAEKLDMTKKMISEMENDRYQVATRTDLALRYLLKLP